MEDPRIEGYMRQMATRAGRLEAQVKALVEAVNAQKTHAEGAKMEISRLQKAYKQALSRIRYIEDIPGKRVPYFMNFEIAVPGPDSPAFKIAGQRLPDVKSVSMDGPFVCTSYLSAFRLKTFSLGPYQFDPPLVGRPGDPPAGTEIITPLTGRYRPIASTADPFSGAYVGYGQPATVPQTAIDASLVNTFRPGTIDFSWEVSDEGVDRQRQNQIPMPSRYLFSEFDRPLYLPVSDFFERGSSIKVQISLTRELGFAEINYGLTPTGFSEGSVLPAPSLDNADASARMIVGLGGVLTFTMLGYKILQAQTPAV